MGKITGNDGDMVAVTITDAFTSNIQTKHGIKLVVSVYAKDAEGNTGEATLWMTPEIREGQDRSDIEQSLSVLESLGLKNGDIRTLGELADKETTFSLSVKDGKTRYYLRTNAPEPVDLDDAYEMIKRIRGEAAKNTAAITGTPVQGDDGLGF